MMRKFLSAAMILATAGALYAQEAQSDKAAENAKPQAAGDAEGVKPQAAVEEEPLRKLRALMRPPEGEGRDQQAVRERLEQVAREAGKLADSSQPGMLQTTARQIRLQAIYAMLSDSIGEIDDKLLTTMRSEARQLKASTDPQAGEAGGYWLMLAEVAEINHSKLEWTDRRRQMRQTMAAYLSNTPRGDSADAVRAAIRRITPPYELTRLPSIDAAAPGAPGVERFELMSPHQPDGNLIRVLLPDKLRADPEKLANDDGYRLLYVLPVEAKLRNQYGDGLAEIQKLDLHNKHDLIVVAPSFSQLPWYADHATDPLKAQQRYVMESLIPAIDRQYPIKHPRRLLLGFSKSGWGAVSLLLRRPDLFEVAAAWDAPLMVEGIDKYGMKDILGTREHFDQYALPGRLKESAPLLHQRPRLILTGYGNFAQPMEEAHRLLEELEVPHEYDNAAHREHRWDTGWVEQAVGLLVKLSE